MLNFIRTGYRGFFEVWLWINLIGCAITGGKVGALLRDLPGGSHGNFVFYGVVIGAVVGIATDILGGGLIAIFLSMDEKLQRVDENLQRLITSAVKKNTAAVNTYDRFELGATTNEELGATTNESVRTDYRSWYDRDGGKHESWIDADGNKHET